MGCSVLGCNNPQLTKTFCAIHYREWRESLARPPLTEAIPKPSLYITTPTDANGCATWHDVCVGTLSQAKRKRWRAEVGQIPPAMMLYRRCPNPRCIAPAHHELRAHGDWPRKQRDLFVQSLDDDVQCE